MKILIVGIPQFRLHLTKTHVDLLLRLGRTHYDVSCKMATVKGTGFVGAWANCIEFCDSIGEQPVCNAIPNELDIALKILEFPPPLSDEEGVLLNEMRQCFRKAMDKANTLRASWICEQAAAE
jgi:hypothetical protein